MKKLLIGAVINIVIMLCVKAQYIEITDISGYSFRGVHPILAGEDQKVEGYYTYYMVEKGEGGERIFEFSIVDKGLSTVTKTQISMHRSAVISNTVFNGNYLLIAYDDKKNKQVKLNLIDKQGKIVVDKALSAEKRYLTNSTVYPDALGEGFYIVTPVKGKKVLGYAIEKVNNKLEQVWRIEELPEKGEKEIEDLINSKDRFTIWENSGPSINGNVIKPAIVCFDSKTGAKIYTRDSYDGISTLLYNQLSIDADGNIYAGGAYVDGEKTKDANNAGVYLLKLDPNGKEILYNKVSNAEKIQEALNAISTGLAVGSKEKVFVEEVIVEGEYIYVIAEMFRKNLNVAPWRIQWTRDLITGKYIGAPDPNAKQTGKLVFEIMDFIIFKFNQKGELVEIKPISKEKKTKITCWYPYYLYGGQRLAKVLRDEGWFDFAFVENDENNQKVMICKDNAELEDNQDLAGKVLNDGPRVFTYSLDESYAQKTINLKQQGKIDLEKGKVSYFNVLRNSTGQIALVYYQRKPKKITLTLEPTH